MSNQISRRAFIAGAAAAPAVTLVPALPASAAPYAIVEGSAPTIEPTWLWWAGDGEHFLEGFATMEQAIEFAREYECREVVRAHHDVLHCPFSFDEDDVFRAMERAEDGSNDPGLTEDGEGFIDIPDDDINDLVDRLNAAAEAWFRERDIKDKLHVYYFQGVSDRIDVEAPEEEP